MNPNISIPRGTADILPSQIPQWTHLECQSHKIFKRFGFEEIRTPIYEDTALFKRSLGQTSDIVNKQLLELRTNKEEGLALRPEGTASIVRAYIENRLDKKTSLSKLFYVGPMFRGERPQKGRLRQFHQMGAEVIGPQCFSPLIDAETIALNIQLLQNFGLHRFQLKLNTLGNKEDKQKLSVYLRKELKKYQKELCEACIDRFERNVFRILDCKKKACQAIVAKIKLDYSHLDKKSLNYFDAVKKALDSLNIPYDVVPQLVRGLDYYTHTVFEISSDQLGSQDALAAGGRYNSLVQDLGGDTKGQIGAMGFSLGMERVLLALGDKSASEADRLDVFIVTMDESYLSQSFILLGRLRNEGVSSDMSFVASSMKSQMRLANKSGARFVLILGDEEMKNQTGALKNMDTSEQVQVEWEEIARQVISGRC